MSTSADSTTTVNGTLSATENGMVTVSGSIVSTTSNSVTTTETLYYAYDANGVPMSLTYTDTAGTSTTYYYATNIQGDVTAILDTTGTPVVEYTYDAWGNPLTITGTMADTLGKANSLRYRGYVYDAETSLYYLQSRYYNPKMDRFINADSYASTDQGLLGTNMFAYCANTPVSFIDPAGTAYELNRSSMDSIFPGAGDIIGFGIISLGLMATLKPAGDAISELISRCEQVEKAVDKSTRQNNSVYVLKDSAGEVQYVGRTNNVEKREAAHRANPLRDELEMVVIASGLNLPEARALEQAGMVYYHTINTANKMNNQINGVAPKYWDAFKEVALGVLKYGWNQMSNEILYWTNN